MPNVESTDHAREARVRRAARRQGLRVCKSPERNHDAPVWGTYMLVDAATNAVVWSRPSGYGLTVDDLEAELSARR